MIALRSDSLLVRIDPAHGAEILDLVELETGRQLLGRPPFGSNVPIAGDLDEDRWTQSYRGGWQTVLPNAGNPCVVGGTRHGFHGRASNDPWELVDRGAQDARLRWEGHGLVVTKHVRVSEALRVDYTIDAAADAVPLVALEHIAVGLELLHPELELDLPRAHAYELDERTGPVRAPAGCATWPDLTLLDGTTERGDRLSTDEPRSRLLALQELPAGWCALRNPARSVGLAVAWDVAFFPHLWVWHEERATAGPWRGLTEMLVIEPASVPHTLGLARALEEGQAWVVRPDAPLRPWVVARPFSADGSVRGVREDGTVLLAGDVPEAV